MKGEASETLMNQVTDANQNQNVPRALTIAGSDSGGGAGIQADIKTFQELDVFGMSAITAVTAQNTLGVHGVYPLTVDAVVQQIDAIGGDLGLDALKTGMLFSAEIIRAVADRISHFGWRQVVVDPVMVAKGGAKLLQSEAVEAITSSLLPLARIVTPNIPEAEVLTGLQINSMTDIREAARHLMDFGPSMVVIKGGHAAEDQEEVVDLVYDGRSFTEFAHTRIHTVHTHGTGCTFSSAITAGLAKGMSAEESIKMARTYIQFAIEDSLGIGGGHGPTNHWAYRRRLEIVR
ncbi:hydroxymethylpyrimidine/phosphomethylpyrimidine kinase [Fontibacillus panacisegetis]|uniref:Hydroxymethylpyrimidine/phosphomethylpyrimidine kinase n=2 Tax=Fontibacillus panacisegetis TaxID=670482 RepID=A0A1G7J8Z1_9BACL|nr:hydroxymethylpyrimidine/phosphomethylpyrimidine kinase [Fontibacillus panacisegetis]